MKIAQIGVGGWGKNHARVLSQFGVLTAVCDADQKRAKETGEKYGVSYYTSVDSMLKEAQFDGVFICTPTSTHFDIASKIIQQKKSVFIEKPMTYESKQGATLLEMAKKTEFF
ncbi:Gfo/Idh/MocA family oxidoreductase [Candidatus Nitrosotenuis chungbukensis]|uniref:Gfo/Idh/MocA family protein n=1 Tax=Candidatus Nitrosotenuis chungbukensis TaxID=1353246 RepID=UPI0026732C6F|nr:Gfo/Idh/MocA family oxidoreductase [Candidatus Nitrosotenuis chungbukensis]WKT58206.1 Gfo/Idh/MocA family oxidoreductase [Candidatus Nitrosotenuis chungbukensis]